MANDPATFTSPFDAVASQNKVYFTAMDPSGVGGHVFVVTPPATTVSVVNDTGTQFVAPLGVAASTDGQTLYVADPAADIGNGDDRGCVLKLPSAGGLAACVNGTDHSSPSAVAVGSLSGQDTVYFIGTNTSGVRGVYSVNPASGAVAKVGTSSYANPTGIAADINGHFFIVDSVGTTSNIIEAFTSASDVVLATGIKTGVPAGIGVDALGQNVYVAAVDPSGKDAVAKIAIATKAVTYSANNGINAFGEPAGLHQTGAFTTYVDATANGGSVFLVTP